MRIERLRRISTSICAALMVLAIANLPRTASATCGDYLAGHHDVGAFNLGLPGTDDDSHDRSTPLPRPCNGTNCRSSRPTPIPVPAPERITTNDHLAVLVHDGAECGSADDFFPGDTDILYSRLQEDGIFHPPRFLGA